MVVVVDLSAEAAEVVCSMVVVDLSAEAAEVVCSMVVVDLKGTRTDLMSLQQTKIHGDSEMAKVGRSSSGDFLCIGEARAAVGRQGGRLFLVHRRGGEAKLWWEEAPPSCAAAGDVNRGSARVTRMYEIGKFVDAITRYIRFIPYIERNFGETLELFQTFLAIYPALAYSTPHIFKLSLEKGYVTLASFFIPIMLALIVYPIWGSDEIHKKNVTHLRALGQSIEGAVSHYFNEDEDEDRKKQEEEALEKCSEIFDSKSEYKDLVRYSRWESFFTMGCRKFPFPWEEYTNLEASISIVGHYIISMYHYPRENNIQARGINKEWCIYVASEVSTMLTQLADSFEKRHLLNPDGFNNFHAILTRISQTREIVEEAESSRQAREIVDEEAESPPRPVGEIVELRDRSRPVEEITERHPTLTHDINDHFSSLLMVAVMKVDPIILAVQELSEKSGFKRPIPQAQDDIV